MKAQLCLCLALLLSIAGCGGDAGDNPRKADPVAPAVVAVNYPIAYMAKRIAGDWLRVEFPVPGDVDPADWQPGVEQVVAVQQASLILLNGAGYAGWVERVSLPEEKLVNTSVAFANQLLPLESVASHTHGLSGEHAHTGFAFTTWLDLEQAIQQAAAIRDALVGLLPDREAELTANYAALAAEFQRLDQRWQTIGARLAVGGVVFSHPVYQYWQRRYQVPGPSVHWEPGVDPKVSDWRAFDELLAQNTIRWMIWEAEPLPAVSAALAERGVESLVLPPVANRPAVGDMMTTLSGSTSLLESRL